MERADQGSAPARRSLLPDLKQRLVSAILLAAVALGVDYAGTWPFAVLVALLSLVMCWEWGRLVRGGEGEAVLALHAASVLLGIGATVAGAPALALLIVLAGAIAAVPLRLGGEALMSALGVLYIGIPAIALVWIRSDEPYGTIAVVLLFIAVWGTDTGAYVAGRSIGGAKLWPSISPNKTWAGLVGGIAAASILSALLALAVPEASVAQLALFGALLGLASQIGDLAESGLKRRYGVKDVSSLIPGHGGFMDRLDGLVAAATVAGVVALMLNVQAPAAALVLLGGMR